MSKLHRSRLDTSLCTRRSGSSQLASDETLSRTACTGTEVHCKPTRSVDQLCEMCPSSTLHSSTHCSNDVSVDPVIGFSAGGSEANVTFERQRLHGEGGEGHDNRKRGTEASKEESDTTNDDRVQHCVQFWSGIQCVDQLGNPSAQRNFDTTITSVLSDNSSVAPICCGHPSEGKDESQTGKCSDDGRGFVKTLSGRLARKLQRSASLVNADLSKNIQTVLDAATVDRCDFVEICCSDVPCLTQAMQRRGLSSFSLLRSDGVGNHDAKTREKMLSWLSEKRPQKAWLSPPVVTHQDNSTRCSLRPRQIFRLFFGYIAAVLSNGGHNFGNGLQSASVGRLTSCMNSELSRKAVVENCFVTACDSCFFANRENKLLEHHRWQFLTSAPRLREYMSLQCRGNHEHVWKQSSEGKRECPVAMIRRLVNGFVHDLRPPQLHMFLSEADRVLSTSPAVVVASPAQETEKDISSAERERVRKLIHPRFWWSCFKDEFETVASASWLSCFDSAHG